jgi:DNA ligase-1
MILATLYQKAKTGKIQQWTIRTEGCNIIKEFGEMGGKLRESEPVACVGKNIGKANETTPEQQAELEIKSQWQKKLDVKYSLTPDCAEETTKILPQHANVFDDHKKKIIYPCIVQHKLNGLNTMAVGDISDIKLQSRGNKSYDTVQHINKALAGKIPANIIPCGEIYLHGINLQECNRRVKKYRGAKSDAMNFNAFDLVNLDDLSMPQDARLELLNDIFSEIDSPSIVVEETFIANNEAEVLAYEKRFVLEGYEGAMVRNIKAPYVLGKETYDVLKVKSFKDKEFPIVGFTDGVGRNKGCVTFTCGLPNGKTFEVVPVGSYSKKAYWFEHGESYVGKMLMVKYFDLSEDGVPMIAVGKPGEAFAIRLEADIDEAA